MSTDLLTFEHPSVLLFCLIHVDLIILFQKPYGYSNAELVESLNDLENRTENGKLYHFAQYRTKCNCIDYFHHFILHRKGQGFTIYECASMSLKILWQLRGVAKIQKKEVSREELAAKVDFKNGLWLILDEEGYDSSECLERAENRVGEKHYLPSGETCETFVRYVLTDKGDSFQLYNMRFGHVLVMSLIEIAAFMFYSYFIIMVPLSIILTLIFGFLAHFLEPSIRQLFYTVIIHVIALVQVCWIVFVLVRYVLCIRKRHNGQRISRISKNVQITKYSISLSAMLVTGIALPMILFHHGYDAAWFFSNFTGLPSFMLFFILTGLLSNFELRRRSNISAQSPLLGTSV